ncbi:MAG: TrbI/VirB10 family protein [Candidatus Omnitrophica bacterium]|nr:TrbI/VirB10 family protein [Candidatus Omnitrophota bacterium]
MYLIDFFLKKDGSGKRNPTIHGFIIIAIVVFLGYHLSHGSPEGKIASAETEGEIINRKDIANAPRRLKNGGGDFFDLPDTNQKNAAGIDLRQRKANASTMVVYDNTNSATSDMVLPYGSIVKCILIHNIVTNNFAAPVIAQTYEDFYFDGELLIPTGTRIYGTAAPGHERDRVLVKFHTLVYQDGVTLKTKAIGLDEDGSAGLSGLVITNRNKKIIISMVTNFLSAFALGLQDTFTNQVTGGENVDTSARNAILEGAGNTFEKEADRIRNEVMQSKGYAIVTAGTRIHVYFEDPLDVKPL